MDSHTAREPCKQAAATANGNEKLTGAKAQSEFFYVCLPDTIDPREPKGR